MLLGAKDLFAIEFELDNLQESEEARARFMNGKFCFWVRGDRIGDYDYGGSLSVALHDCKRLLSYAGRRKEERLYLKSTEDVYSEIQRALYVDSGQSDEQMAEDSAYYIRFEAIPVGFDVFDGWMAFLVEGETTGRYIWRSPSTAGDVLHEQQLPAGEFDRVLSTFVQAFEASE
jgi:hypothetical protein